MLRVWVTIIGCLRILAAEATSTYTLLPTSSDHCKRLKDGKTGGYVDTDSPGIAVVQQIQLQTGVQDKNSSAEYGYLYGYTCEPTFLPLGKVVKWTLDTGGVMKFWYLRLQIDGFISDCKNQLVITEKHSSRHVDDHETPPIVHKCTCKSTFPMIIQAVYRSLQFRWEGPAEGSINSITVFISKYVRFSSNASIQIRRTRCKNAQDLYFCNSSEVCIPGVSHCDGVDDCFDGGSDEVGCVDNSNVNVTKVRGEHSHGSWMTNLPWIALGILPVILIFALARICSQKRQLDIGEDYKMGFNTEDEEEGEDGAVGAAGPGGARSERSISPDDAESGRHCGHEDYGDEGYSLPRHKKTMSASSDYLPANFVELTASPANRARRAENERSSGVPAPFGTGSPSKPGDGAGVAQQPGPGSGQQPQQHVVAVQINNPVYGNNVYVDVPTHASLVKDNEYTRPAKPVVVTSVPKGNPRSGPEEYTPLLPPLPPGVENAEGHSEEKSAAGSVMLESQNRTSGTSDDYEDSPPPYDDLMTPPLPVTQPPKGTGADGERPEMLHLKPLLRPGATTGASGGSSPKGPAPPAPNGSTAAERNNRDSDYDKNYIVV